MTTTASSESGASSKAKSGDDDDSEDDETDEESSGSVSKKAQHADKKMAPSDEKQPKKVKIHFVPELPKVKKDEPKEKYAIHSATDFAKIRKIPAAIEAFFGKQKKKKPKFERKEKPEEEEKKRKKESRDVAAELNQDESYQFYLLSFINLAISVANSVALYLLIKKHRRYYIFLSLLEGYDDAGFEYQIFYILFSTAVISGMGFLITNGKLFGSAKGMLRYMIYIYIGWTAALMAVLAGSLVTCYLLTFVSGNLFQGYRQAMMKFSKSLSMQRTVHKMHKSFRCCGYLNYTEWLAMTWSDKISKMDLGIPVSCCQPGLGEQCVHLVSVQDLHRLTPKKEGCQKKLVQIMHKFLWTVIIFMSASLIGLFLCMVVAVMSVKIIREIDKIIVEQKAREMAIKWLEQKQKEEEQARKEKEEKQRKKLEEFNRAKAAAEKARQERIAALKIKLQQEKAQNLQQALARKQQDAVKSEEMALGIPPTAPIVPSAPSSESSITAGLESIPGLSNLPGASSLLGVLKKL